MTGWNRAVSTLVGAAAAGCLLWVAAAHISRNTTGGYWAAYGIVAGAGLLLAVSQLRGRGGNPPGTFLLAFVPVLIAAGWVLLAMQPHPNWFGTHVLRWSGDIGIRDVVRDLGTWLGLMAFGIGYVFGVTLEPGMMLRRRRAVTAPPAPATATAPASPASAAADEPTAAERSEVGDGRVAERGPATRTQTTTHR
jgi:hypothetical protein